MQDMKDLEKPTSSRGAGVGGCVGSLREGGNGSGTGGTCTNTQERCQIDRIIISDKEIRPGGKEKTQSSPFLITFLIG